MLRILSLKLKLSWFCLGDFNELLEVGDKRGGISRAHFLMQNFRDVLDHCGLLT